MAIDKLVVWRQLHDPQSKWRRHARKVIRAVVDAYAADGPASQLDSELLELVDAAYPFGERKHEPYKCWLKERTLLCEALAAWPTQDEADVCEVARDLVLEGRLDEARRMLEHAPNRLARRCGACGAMPGRACLEPRSECGDPRSGMWFDPYQVMLVPHVSRLVGYVDAAGPLFTHTQDQEQP